MKIEKFKGIIYFNHTHQALLQESLRNFLSFNQIPADSIDVKKVLRELCARQHIWLLEIPIQDKEIGAVYYISSGQKYILLNSAMPQVNINFAVAHELYNIFYPLKPESTQGDIFVVDSYVDNPNEKMANGFAGMLLMPQRTVESAFHYFREIYQKPQELVIRLMEYFSVPYMAILIRLVELDLLKSPVPEEYIDVTEPEIREVFLKYSLNETLLNPSGRNDLKPLLLQVHAEGKALIADGLLSEYQLNQSMERIRTIAQKIGGTAYE